MEKKSVWYSFEQIKIPNVEVNPLNNFSKKEEKIIKF